MSRLKGRLDSLDEKLAKLTNKPGGVVIVRKMCVPEGAVHAGYRETRTGAAWPVEETAWPRVPPGVFVVLDEVWSGGASQ